MSEKFKLNKMIRPMDFCRVVNNKLEKDGFKKGEIVLAMGHKVLPLSLNDLYTQRIYILIQQFSQDKKEIIGEIYLVDPVDLKKVGERKQKELMDKIKETYGDDGPVQEELDLE